MSAKRIVCGRFASGATRAVRGGVDFINNPIEGGFFEFSSTLEIDFAANPN